MADWTQGDWADDALELLGVKPGTQAASADDKNKATEYALAAYERLLKRFHLPFAISAIPEWAQIPLSNYLAADLAPVFGFRESLGYWESRRQWARSELAEQMASDTQLAQAKVYTF